MPFNYWGEIKIFSFIRGLKNAADGDCSHEIKKILAPWQKSYVKPRQHIKKQKHHFANKGPYSQTTVCPVAMYRCESWIIRKTECQEELMLSNCGAGEDSWESLGQQEDQISQS